MSSISGSRSEPALWMVRANSICLARQVLLGVVGQQPGQQQQRVQRGAQLVAHVGQELRLVRRARAELLRLLLQAEPGQLDLPVLGLDVALLLAEQLGLVLQLGVGALQLGRLVLQLPGQPLGLRQQLLGAPVGLDRVERDADRGDQPLQERQVQRGERRHRGELDHAEHLALEQHRQHDQVVRRRRHQAGAHRQDAVVGGPDPDRPAGHRGLPDQSLARPEGHLVVAGHVAVRRGQPQPQHRLLVVDQEERAELGVHQRRHLGHDHAADLAEVALALQQAADPGQVGVQPALLGVRLGGLAQGHDHLVDVVLELGDLALRLDRDPLGQVAAGHRGGHLGDRAQLGGQRGGELVDVLGEVAPRTGDALDLGLTAELALDADLAGRPGSPRRRTTTAGRPSC